MVKRESMNQFVRVAAMQWGLISTRPESSLVVFKALDWPAGREEVASGARRCEVCLEDDPDVVACSGCLRAACAGCWTAWWSCTAGPAATAADLGRRPCLNPQCAGWAWEDVCADFPTPGVVLDVSGPCWVHEGRRLDHLEARAALTTAAHMNRLQAAQNSTRHTAELVAELEKVRATRSTIDQDERRWTLVLAGILQPLEREWKARADIWPPWPTGHARMASLLRTPHLMVSPTFPELPWYGPLRSMCCNLESPTPLSRSWQSRWGEAVARACGRPTGTRMHHPLHGLMSGLMAVHHALIEVYNTARQSDWPVVCPGQPTWPRTALTNDQASVRYLESVQSCCAWVLHELKATNYEAKTSAVAKTSGGSKADATDLDAADLDAEPEAPSKAEPEAPSKADAARQTTRWRALVRQLARYHMSRTEWTWLLEVERAVVDAINELWPHVQDGPAVHTLFLNASKKQTIWLPWCQRTWDTLARLVYNAAQENALAYEVWGRFWAGTTHRVSKMETLAPSSDAAAAPFPDSARWVTYSGMFLFEAHMGMINMVPVSEDADLPGAASVVMAVHDWCEERQAANGAAVWRQKWEEGTAPALLCTAAE